MEVNILPTEDLEYIFKHLSGRDLLACRKVCVRWSEILKNLHSVWRNACRQEIGEGYQKARDRAGLSWAELYASLSLWPAVNAAKVETHKLATSVAPLLFEVLQNGIIGVPQRDQSFNGSDGFNTIVYYDLNTLKECRRKNFEFNFIAYKENENFIVIVDTEATLYAVSKISNKRVIVGKVDHLQGENFISCCYEFYGSHKIMNLFENIVYFRNDDYSVFIAKLTETNGTFASEIILDDYLSEEIVSVCHVDSNNMNLLLHEGHYTDINTYSFLNKHMATKATISYERENNSGEYLQRDIERFGFNWRSSTVLLWMIHFGVEIEKQDYFSCVRSLDSCVCLAHGDVILLGTHDHILHVYYKPFDAQGILRIDDAKPIRSFDLRVILNVEPTNELWQLDVIEIVDGHRVIVTVKEQIYVLELSHGFHD